MFFLHFKLNKRSFYFRGYAKTKIATLENPKTCSGGNPIKDFLNTKLVKNLLQCITSMKIIKMY